MDVLSLNGRWTLVDVASGDDRSVEVPGCWEDAGISIMDSGPYLYRRQVTVPAGWAHRHLSMRFEGVSYHAIVRLDGHEVAHHRGTWDAFEVDVSGLLDPGKPAELEVEVRKPAGLVAGPDSEQLPGPFPLRETLAGFLPYVWGHVFGGIWQDVSLRGTGGPGVLEFFGRGDRHGTYDLSLVLTHEADVEIRVLDPGGDEVATHHGRGRQVVIEGELDAPVLWSPASPRRYVAEVRVDGHAAGSYRFGFRSVAHSGTTILLNGEPVYPRLSLSWGWYPNALNANPALQAVRQDFERLLALGFNGVKFCLWVPPDAVLELADELGLLVWLELPMWLPKVTEAFLEQTPHEYDRIVRQVRHHPSIVLYSLGCELNSSVGADLLGRLYRSCKALVGDAMLRDNSGSGVAYGGLLDEYAEYYDYHFYAELPNFRPLLDHFAPRSAPEQPFLFGEFCDSDTFRDLRTVDDEAGGRPWWADADPVRNPQGARWQYDAPVVEARLRESGFWQRGEELVEVSYKQALLQRKTTIEIVRGYREVGGYVVTGERDTPISTSGVLDDRGRSKFDDDAFRSFNDDTVLSLGWDRRRAWIDGGDRPAPWDPYGYREGDQVRAHVIVSHYGSGVGPAEVRWQLIGQDGRVHAAGGETSMTSYRPGTVREAAIARFRAPTVVAPEQMTLAMTATIAGREVRNAWPLWIFPRRTLDTAPTAALLDPGGAWHGIDRVLNLEGRSGKTAMTVASQWTPALDAQVRDGASALLWVRGRDDDPVASSAMPFWREGIKVLEPHPAWGSFPHQGWTDLQFFGLSPDLALAVDPAIEQRPILRRVDARTMAVNDYATVVRHGRGRLLVSTLRFGGGMGEQALGLGRNVCAQELLLAWCTWLAQPSNALG